MPSFDFMAVHADRWTKLLPKLTAAGKKGYHVVGFLSEGGCYSALMEKADDVEVVINVQDPALRIDAIAREHLNDTALGPREMLFRPPPSTPAGMEYDHETMRRRMAVGGAES